MSAPAMRVAERVVETRALEISSCSALKDSMTSSLAAHASVAGSGATCSDVFVDAAHVCPSQLSFQSWRDAIDDARAPSLAAGGLALLCTSSIMSASLAPECNEVKEYGRSVLAQSAAAD